MTTTVKAIPLVLATLLLAACGGSGQPDQSAASAPAATATAVAAPEVPAAAQDVLAGMDIVTPGATAMPPRPPNAAGRAGHASSKPIAATPPTAAPVPLVLDPKAIYDDWSVASTTAHALVLTIASNSCHGGPQITVDETPTSVTILITEQLFGPADCHGILKIVREVAGLHAPLGNRSLQGCRPMREKAGARINCRTVKQV